jgi:hypothetical protein
MYVCWNAKRGKEDWAPEQSKLLGKKYTRIGDALYKMYQLYTKGYTGIHLDFEDHEYWEVDGQYKPLQLQGDGWLLQVDDKKWDPDLDDYKSVEPEWCIINDSHQYYDFTQTVKYFQKYRTKKIDKPTKVC